MTIEVKLIVGHAWGFFRNESVVIDKPKDSEIDGTNIFSLHDFDKGVQYHKLTGKRVYSFKIIATFGDLRFSRESNLFSLDITNLNEKSDYWEWLDEFTNERIDRDWEGDRLNPIPLTAVLEALKKDIKDNVVNDEDLQPDDLTWHEWIINALEAMPEIENKFALIYFR